MLSALDDEDTITVKDDEIAYMGVMLTQMSLKAGLKAFGDRGKASAYILDNNVIPEEQALEDVPVRTRSGSIRR